VSLGKIGVIRWGKLVGTSGEF